jgi:hypothetical protein
LSELDLPKRRQERRVRLDDEIFSCDLLITAAPSEKVRDRSSHDQIYRRGISLVKKGNRATPIRKSVSVTTASATGVIQPMPRASAGLI